MTAKRDAFHLFTTSIRLMRVSHKLFKDLGLLNHAAKVGSRLSTHKYMQRYKRNYILFMWKKYACEYGCPYLDKASHAIKKNVICSSPIHAADGPIHSYVWEY